MEGFVIFGVESATTTRDSYLADSLQGQAKVKPVSDFYNACSRDHMVDPLVCLKGQVEQTQDGLVVGDVGRLEHDTSGASFFRRELIARFSQESFSSYVVRVSKTNIGTFVQALVDQAGPDAMGTAYGKITQYILTYRVKAA